jgi:hypothetical protein
MGGFCLLNLAKALYVRSVSDRACGIAFQIHEESGDADNSALSFFLSAL